ncbi:zinc finger lsd1 subclass family protein (macronuclear) [Tetrahymena thermophila SB210]|uniref:Zinc finger lsd1 subclass family protein n=1 Tax=Tetrahymena thermophila (strain SB210) TaxID=312017 RepID=W7XLL2_TETTS|nr:zinc finger lsd1 subclass family protein [Tetrahymena thermophila SB210]EWS76484.1 zinc finger lsd1 subclass family protein [Tetrahymena thermophila SB210]|eukprot:XP_012650984.1 zinc finger lsd1 subclass family protein [Tetrahymena thermophila SB210]
MNSNYGVFQIDNLPPHYRRELRMEIFHMKESKIQLSFQLDNLSPVTVQFNKGSIARLQIPCQSNSGNSYDSETEYFYNFNQVNDNLPSTNSVSTFSVLEQCNDNDSYLRIKSIQFNIESCHNSCLSCTGPTESNCSSCDSTCATLQNQQCILKSNIYRLQEGKCVNTCSIPHFQINNKCVWIPNCQAVSSGKYCTQCQVGFLPVQTENFETQCQKYCPKDYSNVNGICVDNKINISGQYLLNGFFKNIFSSYEIEQNNINLTGQMQVNVYSSKYTRCGEYQLLGGYFSNFSGTQIFTKQYSTKYKLLRVSFKWILIDYNSNQNPNISIQLQGQNTQTQNLSLNGSQQQQICGLNTQDYIGDFQYDFNVPTGTFSIIISNQMADLQTQESDKYDKNNRHQYFGIRELQIYAFNCIQSFCILCSSQLPNTCQQCDIGYYLNNGTCVQCSADCQECQNGTQCTVCKGGKILNLSKICSCPSQQYWNGQNCLACQNKSCDICDASDSTKCLTCPPNFYLFNQNCLSDCPPLTYKNTNTLKCESCLTNCKTCQDATSCQLCQPNYYLSADKKSCQLTCPQGQQQNSNSYTCIPCQDSNCQLCQQQIDQCTKCGNNYNLQGNKCQQYCDPSYYSDNFVCKLCSQKYLNCQQCNLTQCIQCQPTYFLYNGTCTNICPTGYFQDTSISIQKCTKCSNTSCQTCDPSLSSKCLTCSNLQYKQGDNCVDNCDSNMFPNSSRVCTLCSSKFIGCLQCTSTQCLSCVNSTDYLDKQNNSCGSTCPQSTFKDSSGTPPSNVCTACDSNCKSCEQVSTQCTSCNNDKYLQGITCQSSCDSSYYPNSDRKCTICSSKFPNCTQCTASQCFQCNLPYFFVEGQSTCQIQCPQGYGPISTATNNTCKPCTNNDCKSCQSSNLNLCDSCYPNSSKPYLSGTSCISSCASNEYVESATNKCILCSLKTQGCDTCTETACKSCSTQYLDVTTGKCVDDCVTLSLKSIETPIKKCVLDCVTIDPLMTFCVNCQTDAISKTMCLECENGKYLDQGLCQGSCPGGKYPDINSICQPCSNKFEGCNKCTFNSCTSCLDSTQYYDSIAQKCVVSCEYGANPQLPSFICQSCLKNTCKQCSQSDLSQCTSCFSDGMYQYLQNGDCVQSCSNKYYTDSLSCKLCSDKIPYCDICNTDGCLQCSSNYYLSIDKQQCTPLCPDKQYGTSVNGAFICQYCQNSRCLQCDSSQPNLCLICDQFQSTKYLENGQCQLSCSDHSFPDSQNICKKCESKFQNCDSCNQSNCLSCNVGYYLDVQTYSCVVNCPKGMYGSNFTKQCEFCDQKNECEICDPQKPNNCTKCISSLYLQNGFCTLNCTDGTYPDSNNICQPCSDFDANCIKCNSKYCTQCQSGDIYLDVVSKKCINTCLDGYYKNQDQFTGVKTCEICLNTLCKTCQADGSCLSCYTSNLEQYLNGNQCVQTCPKYIDDINKLCVESCPSSNQVPDKTTQKCTICSQKIYNLECLANCPQGTVEDPLNSNLCVQCKSIFSNCDICDQNNCLKCLPNNFLNNGKCSSDCPLNTYKNYQNNECVSSCNQSGYFADQNSKSCLQCNTNTCSECVDTKDKCTKCIPGKFYYESLNQCYSDCPQKTYKDILSQKCLPCDQKTCLKCEGGGKCLECEDFLNEDDHKCYQDCPNGKYYYLQKCVKSCQAGQYLDQVQNTCFDCPDNCVECLQNNECTKCLPSYMSNSDKNQPQICDQCIDGYFLQNQICIKCSIDCQTCLNSASECQTCSQGYNLDFKKQCIVCNQDQYFDEINKKCMIKQTGGVIPKLQVLDEIQLKDNKILIQAKITFSEEIFVIEPNWNMNLDSVQSQDYQISYDIVHEQEINFKFNSSEIGQKAQKLKALISITIEKNSNNQYKQLLVDFMNEKNIVQSQNFGLKIIKLQGNLPEYDFYKYPQMSKSTEISQALIGTSYFALVLGAPFYMLVSFFDILQLTNYLLYLNVQYQDILYNVIKLFDFANFEFIPNIKKDNSSSPFKFRMEKIDTFIYSNLVQSIVIWLFSFLTYILNAMRSYHNQYFFQIIIGLSYLTYCDLLLSVFLQFYDSTNMTASQLVGVITATVLLLGIVALNILTFKSTRIQTYQLIFNDKVKSLYGYLYSGIEMNQKKAVMNLLFLFRRSFVIQQLVFNSSNPITFRKQIFNDFNYGYDYNISNK